MDLTQKAMDKGMRMTQGQRSRNGFIALFPRSRQIKAERQRGREQTVTSRRLLLGMRVNDLAHRERGVAVQKEIQTTEGMREKAEKGIVYDRLKRQSYTKHNPKLDSSNCSLQRQDAESKLVDENEMQLRLLSREPN